MSMTKENPGELDIVHQEFVEIFEEEEIKMMPEKSPGKPRKMHNISKAGAVWFWHGIASVDVAWFLVADPIGLLDLGLYL